MDRIYSPWRYAYVTRARPDEGGCVLCEVASASSDTDGEHFVVARGEHQFVVLNLFPYNSGHLMIVPYEHVSRLSDLPEASMQEMVRLAARAERALGEIYRPEGVNLGMNLGRSAGAGIADHIHLHVVPRWAADTNFMTVAGETRVLPESLHETWKRLSGRI